MNKITATFTRGSYKVQTAPLWQYDYGQILEIKGLELPSSYEVHFSNQQNGVATTSLGNSDGVAIPDAYLKNGNVYAWLYLHTGESDGETVYEIEIPVRARASISNQPPTPVQQDVITQTIAALNAGVTEVEGIAEQIPQTIYTALAEAKSSGEFDGKDGDDGFSPAVSVETITGGHQVTVTDASGSESFNVMDGEVGADGKDGHSPVVTASKSGKVTTVSVDGNAIATINDGEDGQDGYSPTATVSKSGHKATITITDTNGTTTAEVDDGTFADVQWEQINEVTLAEDSEYIEIITDSNGDSFELTDMIAVFTCGQPTTGTRDYFYGKYYDKVLYNGSIVDGSDSVPSAQYSSATSNMAAQYRVTANYPAPVTMSACVSSSNGSSGNIQSMPKDRKTISIRGLRIYQSGAGKSLVPSGAKLTLWGRRKPT